MFVTEGDTLGDLELEAVDAQDAALDLTGRSVSLEYKVNKGTLQTRTASVLDPPTAGKALYEWVEGDLSEAGELEGFFVIRNNSDGKKLHTQRFKLTVHDDTL